MAYNLLSVISGRADVALSNKECFKHRVVSVHMPGFALLDERPGRDAWSVL